MATGEQLKSLVKSHVEGDEERFFTLAILALQVAAYEARRGHGKLDQDIRALIDSARIAAARLPESRKPTPIVHPCGELAGLFTTTGDTSAPATGRMA